jgi:protease-4
MFEPILKNESNAQPPVSSGANWERAALERVALSVVQEQRRARRWSIFFRLVGLALFALVAFKLLDHRRTALTAGESGRHTALIDLHGVIEAGGDVNADAINSALQKAFKDHDTAGIVLRINSPGGSPVQSGLMYDEIRRLRAKYPDKPLYAVVEDICASGGYYIASAADRIYVDKASLVGSIGVIMESFGAVELLKKAGVERRVLTAGENKAILDPFSPMREKDKAHAQQMLDEIHQQFIAAVRAGRGNRLKEDKAAVFSGLFWSGAHSIELGLADEFGSLNSVARGVIKAERIVDFSPHDNPLDRLAKRFGASVGEVLMRPLAAGLGAPATLR